MAKKTVVIGGVACGPKAAARLRRLDPDREITLVERGEEISYGACGLPFYLEGQVADLAELVSTPVGVPRDVNFFRAVKGFDVRIRTEAVSLDRAAKTVRVKDHGSGREEDIPYDTLVLATGSRPVRPALPGIDLDGVHCLKTMADGSAIKAAMEGASSRRAVIVGAGLIGLECVEALLKGGFEVHVVEKLGYPLPALLDEEMAVPLKKHLEAKGVRLHFGDGLVRFEDDGNGRLARVVTEKTSLEADLAILAIGFRPNVDLAVNAGLAVGRFGIKVDSFLRTSDPSIFAGGDCVENRHLVTGRPLYAALGSTANKHGRVIGENLAGWKSTFPGVSGTGICRVLGFNVGRTGLSEREARAEGYEVVTALNPGGDKPHYIREKKAIHIKLVAEAYSGRVLGAQILGPGDALSRLDTVAAVLTMGGTVADLANVDMAYAPPFSPAVDNIIVAANIVQNKMAGVARAYSPAEVKGKVTSGEDFVLLDVRTPKEVEALRLPYENVVHIPLGKLRERAGELPEGKEIVPFCLVSLRGYEASRILLEKGFDPARVRFMDGGLLAWPYEKVSKG